MRAGRVRLAVGAAAIAVTGAGCLVVGEPEPAPVATWLHDVGPDGVAVGSYWRPPPAPIDLVRRAIAYDTATGEVAELGPHAGASEALAVDDDGVAVGWVEVAGASRAHVWDLADGSDLDLGTLGGLRSAATDVNADGVVVGWSEVPGGARHAFAYDPATGVMDDLGTLGGTSSEAHGISDAGIVVGHSDLSGDAASHAFALDLATGVMTDLGTLGGSASAATDVNEHGVVVGWSEIPGDDPCEWFGDSCPPTRAFAHDLASGVTTDLRVLRGHTHSAATAVNDGGIVTGVSSSPATPTCGACPPLQEATLFELGTGARYHLEGFGDLTADGVNEDGLVVGGAVHVENPPVWVHQAFAVPVTQVVDEPAG